jgi:hypothetical protein
MFDGSDICGDEGLTMSLHKQRRRNLCCVCRSQRAPEIKPVLSYGRCLEHYRELVDNHPEEIARLKTLTVEEQNAEYSAMAIELPHFEYEGDEETLAKLYGGGTNHAE